MRYTDEEVRRIVSRAVALQDRLDATLSADEVRAVLSEIGVSPTVTDVVLSDVTLSDVVRVETPVPRRLREPLPALHAGVFGLTAGLAAALSLSLLAMNGVTGHFFGPGIVTSILFSSGMLFSGILAVRNRAATSRPFQNANLALWAGIAGGFTALTGIAKMLLAGSSLTVLPWSWALAWVFTAVGGRLLSNYTRDSSDDAASTPGGPIARVMSRVKTRFVERARAWLDTIQTRTRAFALR